MEVSIKTTQGIYLLNNWNDIHAILILRRIHTFIYVHIGRNIHSQIFIHLYVYSIAISHRVK